MKRIDFIYQKQHFTLDLIQGVLHGADKALREHLTREIDALASRQGYLGGGHLPEPPTRITEPYRDAGQFALCMSHITGTDFPIALEAFIPRWASEENEQALDGSVPLPLTGTLVCY